METALAVPDAAVRYILFQRTAYLRFPVAPLYRWTHAWLPFPTPLYNLVVAVEARLNPARTKALYAADMAREFATLRPHLPPQCAAILDIGCGVAGIDALLARHYTVQQPHLFLLDKSRVDARIWYLFQPEAAFYNSLAVAQQLLRLNGVTAQQSTALEVGDDGKIPLNGPVDLVISLLSWGFHYPVATYLDRVARLLSGTGSVILDVRKGTDGLALLRRTWPRVEVIVDTPKYQRVVARPERV